MKQWKDPFPRTPERFSLRVEQTLLALEDRDMKRTDIRRKTLLLVAAALAALLAVAAAAVVAGNSNLKERLEREGVGEVADLVQEPHAGAAPTGTAEGFDFSVDEILWEDDDLYISYSLSVPADGRYMVAMYTPTLNGEKLEYDAKGWTVAKFFDGYGEGQCPTALLLGGSHRRRCNELWTFRVDPKLRDGKDNRLKFRAVLLKTDADLEGGGGDWTDLLDPPDIIRFNPDRGDWDLDAMPAAELAFQDAAVAAFGDDGRLSLDELIGTGHAEYADEREIDLALDGTKLEQVLYNDVAERDFDVDGCHLHVDSFRMTHLGARIGYTLSAPEGDADAMRRLNDLLVLNWGFGTVDGEPLGFSLGASGSAGLNPRDGAVSYSVCFEEHAILPLTDPERIVYAPVTYRDGADGDPQTPVYDLRRAITLTPIYAEEAAAQETAAPQRDLDPGETDLSR